MKRKPKILVFAKNIDSGTGTFALQLLRLGKEYDIKIYFLERKRYRTNEEDKNVVYFSKKPVYKSYYKINIFFIREFYEEMLWFRKVLMEQKPEIIVSFNAYCNLLALIVKFFISKQIKNIIITDNNISKVIDNKVPNIVKPILVFFCSIVFKKADVIICVSKGVAHDFKKIFNIKKEIEIIYCGRDMKFSKYKKNLKEKDKKIVFISVGRFEKQKDFPTLVKAFAATNKLNKQISLVLVGDGKERKSLQSLVKSLGIDYSVNFVGWRENVQDYLRKSDIFVLSSHYEGFGLVLVEAMAMGLPVISTDSPYGPSEILDNGKYGILVPVGDVNYMKKAFVYLIKNKKKRQEFSRKSILRSKYFSELKMLEEYNKIIKTTLRN